MKMTPSVSVAAASTLAFCQISLHELFSVFILACHKGMPRASLSLSLALTVE